MLAVVLFGFSFSGTVALLALIAVIAIVGAIWFLRRGPRR
jgi:hypothetical protein